jgi:hypothetical protein
MDQHRTQGQLRLPASAAWPASAALAPQAGGGFTGTGNAPTVRKPGCHAIAGLAATPMRVCREP